MERVNGQGRKIWPAGRIVSLLHAVGLLVAFLGMVVSSVSTRYSDGDPHGYVTIFSMMGAVLLVLPLVLVLVATRLVWRGRDTGLLILGAYGILLATLAAIAGLNFRATNQGEPADPFWTLGTLLILLLGVATAILMLRTYRRSGRSAIR